MSPELKKIDEELTALCSGWNDRCLRARDKDKKAITTSMLLDKDKNSIANLTAQMAATSIPDPKPPKDSSSKQSEATPSIVIGGFHVQDIGVELFGESIKFATDVLSTVSMGGIDDLKAARESLEEVTNKKQALSKFMAEKNPKFTTYQVVSFSALTKKHLAEMGVTTSNFGERRRDKLLRAFDAFELPATQTNDPKQEDDPVVPSVIFEEFWTDLTKDRRFINDFKLLKDNVGKKSEARARMLTDYILIQLMSFVHTRLNLVQLMFVELVLSSLGDPVSVGHGKYATLLTGTVDYAIMSSAEAKSELAILLDVEVDEVDEKIRVLNREGSLDDLKSNPAWVNSKSFKFTIIEEKKKITGGKKLKDYEPQVTGEALALGLKTGQESVLWCLSNGEDWIFGILNSSNKQSRSFPPMFIQDSDLEGSIKAIFKMLIVWTICPMDMLT